LFKQYDTLYQAEEYLLLKKSEADDMCTAATYKTKDFYFGRTLDYEFSYGDEITITPRNFPFKFRHTDECSSHFAMIGMAHIADGYPLYYDAMNEKGLCMAGLNFVGNAVYFEPKNGKENIAQFEFIPYILSHCDSVLQARKKLESLNITNTQFSDRLPCAQLHWIISDKDESLTVESTKDGLKVYDNPVGVLTNNPPFDIQMFMLNNYMSLSPKQPENNFGKSAELTAYSRGMGAIGLPGDLSSASRFAKVAFTKLNSVSGDSESESVSQFFHILGSVDQQRGCCEVADGKYEITIYTSCCNADKGIYYYTTYNNHQICAVDMHKTDLDSAELTAYKPISEGQVFFQN
jgi:penicillin V amidase